MQKNTIGGASIIGLSGDIGEGLFLFDVLFCDTYLRQNVGVFADERETYEFVQFRELLFPAFVQFASRDDRLATRGRFRFRAVVLRTKIDRGLLVSQELSAARVAELDGRREWRVSQAPITSGTGH